MKTIKLELDGHGLVVLIGALNVRIDQISNQVRGIEFSLAGHSNTPPVSSEMAGDMRENLGLYAEESEALITIIQSIQEQMK